jgi:phage terminase small subunit
MARKATTSLNNQDRPLTPRQSAFVREYLIDLNATQAAIRAGYSEKTACEQGAQNLAKLNISRAIADGQAKLAEKSSVSAQWVIDNLVEVSQRCLQKAPVMVYDRAQKSMVQATDEQGQGIWQFDSSGANRALELIGKHLNIFRERVELTGKDGGAIAGETKVVIYLPGNGREGNGNQGQGQ